ncbi:MAG: hypothetical protein WBY88_12120, partial [Desulfosarcina sp.]
LQHHLDIRSVKQPKIFKDKPLSLPWIKIMEIGLLQQENWGRIEATFTIWQPVWGCARLPDSMGKHKLISRLLSTFISI